MKIIYALLICWSIFPCKAQGLPAGDFQSLATSARDTFPNEIITIPVVVHVLYNNEAHNITDAQVLSQIESLNNDYRKLNNTTNIPAAFSSLAADVKINFCIAKTDPAGKPTNGIIHKYTPIAQWPADDEMKFSASGGDNAWDSKRYLNIWVCDLAGKSLGYSSLLGSQANKDGVVIQYDVFGTTGNVRAPFDKGRTATHEIGHWLGLMHLWGDVLCGDDMVADTPPQRTYNNGCPLFPHISACSINSNGDMFMNFMDFTDDACMSMFTHGQKNKMRSLFASGHARNSFLNSKVCSYPSPEEAPVYNDKVVTENGVSLYPVPAKDFVTIEAKSSKALSGKTLVIYNMSGVEIKRQLLTSSKSTIQISNIAAGVYVVKIGEGNGMEIIRLVKQ